MEKEEKGKAKAVQIQYYQSPCGKLILGSFEDKLCMFLCFLSGRNFRKVCGMNCKISPMEQRYRILNYHKG